MINNYVKIKIKNYTFKLNVKLYITVSYKQFPKDVLNYSD